jgi:hypothetical protein
MYIGYSNDKNFAISPKLAKKWEKMTDENDHARVTYEQIAHMAKGVKKSCGAASRLYAEISTLAVKAKAVLEYRDENNGFNGGDEMYYIGLAYYNMACAIVNLVASHDATEAYNKCA